MRLTLMSQIYALQVQGRGCAACPQCCLPHAAVLPTLQHREEGGVEVACQSIRCIINYHLLLSSMRYSRCDNMQFSY